MKKFLFYTLLYLIFTSCSKEKIAWEHEETPSPNTSITESNDGVIILGKRLENPYSLKNMKQAFENLAPQTRNGIQEKDILPTHYYVKFHPKSEHELDILKQDTTVIWYEYPLDYEIKTLGVSYHDPAIPDSLPTYQYASIDIAKVLGIAKAVPSTVVTELKLLVELSFALIIPINSPELLNRPPPEFPGFIEASVCNSRAILSSTITSLFTLDITPLVTLSPPESELPTAKTLSPTETS